jgi:hypothetical protein
MLHNPRRIVMIRMMIVYVQGLVISCCLICAVLFFSAAWDYMLQYWVALAPTLVPPIEAEEPAPDAQVHNIDGH